MSLAASPLVSESVLGITAGKSPHGLIISSPACQERTPRIRALLVVYKSAVDFRVNELCVQKEKN